MSKKTMSKNQFGCKTFDQAKQIAAGLRDGTDSGNAAAEAYLRGYHRRNQIEFAASQESKSYEQL